jgi:hypothetical protein
VKLILIDNHSYAALWSIGLERYAPFFEERGVYTVEDYKKFTDDSEVLCLELELDPSANNLLAELSAADANSFRVRLRSFKTNSIPRTMFLPMINYAGINTV